MIVLPRLDIAETMSPFDEAVIIIDGHEEETITIECPDALELAQLMVQLLNEIRRLQHLPTSNPTSARAVDC